jgi:hypothetical protein
VEILDSLQLRSVYEAGQLFGQISHEQPQN